MKNNKQFPILINHSKSIELRRRALFISRNLENHVLPTLLCFGLSDDEHIRKYMSCPTYEEVYRDLEKEQPEKLSLLEYDTIYRDIDAFKRIREASCSAKLPKDEDFVFAKCPIYCESGELLSGLTVENGKITIDEAALDKASIIKPTPEQERLYEYVADFCEGLKDYQQKRIPDLLTYDEKGRIVPNPWGIVSFSFF